MAIDLPDSEEQRKAYGALYNQFRALLDECDWDFEVEVSGDLGDLLVRLSEPASGEEAWASN